MLGHFAVDLLRGLVLAERNEARVAKDAVGREFGEVDLGDEARLDPVRALAFGARNLGGGLVGLERLHLFHQFFDQVAAESRADLAGIFK